ncbi:MAG: hypothetical protein IT289_09280 [Oligoflexia bacterium]|nr:hypothetical protein [Oligoflexia bacterium]
MISRIGCFIAISLLINASAIAADVSASPSPAAAPTAKPLATKSQAVKAPTPIPNEVVRDDIDTLKERVLDKKTHNLLFRQLMKTEAVESSYPVVTIKHINEMSSRYKIFTLVYLIDNERVFVYSLEDNLGKKVLGRETNVFKGPLVPGTHELSVEVVYQGNDAGVFSYINEYKIPTSGKKTFKVDKGQAADIQVVGFEKGWALTDFKDRPDLKFKIYSAKSSKDLQ